MPLTPQQIAWILGILMLATGLIATVARTGKFLVWTVPDGLMHFLTAFLGASGAFSATLAAGGTLIDALLAALGGLGAGAGLSLHHASSAAVAQGVMPLKTAPALPSKVLLGTATGAFALMVFAVAMSGCQLFHAAKVPSDIEAVYACVEGEIAAGDTKLLTIEEKCAPAEIALIADVVDSLTQPSTSFAKEHPAETGALREQVSAQRSDAGAK